MLIVGCPCGAFWRVLRQWPGRKSARTVDSYPYIAVVSGSP
jgi:hypothetical protein